MNRKKFMSLAIMIIFIYLTIFLVGCEEVKTKPYIKSITTSEQTIPSEQGEFKLYFTIANPTAESFVPYIKVLFDENNIVSKEYNVKKGESVQLSSISRNQEKAYYLSFGTSYQPKPGSYSLNLAVYNLKDALEPLDKSVSTLITISEKVK